MNDDTPLRDGPRSRGDDGQGPRSCSGGTAAGAGHEHTSGTGVYAALDLGTNNCRLLIACPFGDGFRVVDSFSRIIRLGEGISATGCISEAAIERAIAALSICRDKIHSKKAKRLRLIATEACRAASNADGFRDRVAAATEHGNGAQDMHLLGTSGTVTTLAGIHLNLARYDRRRVDGIWMDGAQISATIDRLLGMSYQERASNNCISVDRADLVLAGCAI